MLLLGSFYLDIVASEHFCHNSSSPCIRNETMVTIPPGPLPLVTSGDRTIYKQLT